jgi:hypothetical protein
MRRIVKFEPTSTNRFPDSMPPAACELVSGLMCPAVADRLTLSAAQQHPFFRGLDPTTLYTQDPPPLAQGLATPAPHASWTRRQNSMMWSPLPQRYSFAADVQLACVQETEVEADAPFRGTLPHVPVPTGMVLSSVGEDKREDREGGAAHTATVAPGRRCK